MSRERNKDCSSKRLGARTVSHQMSMHEERAYRALRRWLAAWHCTSQTHEDTSRLHSVQLSDFIYAERLAAWYCTSMAALMASHPAKRACRLRNVQHIDPIDVE
eukprot:scaffold295655_cov22-Tisochrysis_lutea.AAC.1